MPATTLLTRDDLADRFARGRVRHVVAGADNAGNFAELPGDYTRLAVGGAAPGWRRYEEPMTRRPHSTPEGETRASDPLLLYFTSGTTAKPKLVLHSHQSYPVGHLSTMYWLGLQPGDVHLQHLFAGLGEARVELLLRAVECRRHGVHAQPAALRRRALLDAIVRCGVTTFCAPPTVWRMLVQEDLGALEGEPARSSSAPASR